MTCNGWAWIGTRAVCSLSFAKASAPSFTLRLLLNSRLPVWFILAFAAGRSGWRLRLRIRTRPGREFALAAICRRRCSNDGWRPASGRLGEFGRRRKGWRCRTATWANMWKTWRWMVATSSSSVPTAFLLISWRWWLMMRQWV